MSSFLWKFFQLFPSGFRTRLKSLWLFLFDRFSFRAHCDYIFTDEKLKFVHLLEAINYVRIAGAPYAYFEFGCHSGRTFSAVVRACRYLKLKDFQFYAFDSFQGLPNTSAPVDGYFKSGTFSTPVDVFLKLVYNLSGYKLSHKNIVQGFFNESLTPEIQQTMPKVGVVHIDVDLYSSTVDVLNFIKPSLVVGTVLLFDDWYCFSPGSSMGESRALQEFLAANPNLSLEPWKNYSTFGKSFFVTSLP